MANINYKKIIDCLVCPDCATALELLDLELQCTTCAKKYFMKDGIFSFLPEQTRYWEEIFSDKLKNINDRALQVGYFSMKSFALTQKMIQEKLGNKTDCNVLDVGCGHGLMSKWLTERKNMVIGVDFTLDMLKAAGQRGLFPLHADGMKLPLKKMFFDVVMSIEVIQHVDDSIGFVQYISGFVKPGGALFISGLSSHSILRKLNRKTIGAFKPGHNFPKLRDPVKLAYSLTKSGFEVEVSYTCFPFNKIIVGKVGKFKKHSTGSNFFIMGKKNG